MPDLRKLRNLIQPSSVTEGDGTKPTIPLFCWHHVNTNTPQAISSIILAIEMIIQYCKKLKYKRRIVLVTDGKGPMDADGIDAIVSKVNEEGIEMTILCDITHPIFSAIRFLYFAVAWISMTPSLGSKKKIKMP